MPNYWSSINSYKNDFLEKKVGITEEEVKSFLTTNTDNIVDRLNFIEKILNRLLEENLFSEDKRTFNWSKDFI